MPAASFDDLLDLVHVRPSACRVAVATEAGWPTTLGRLNDVSPPKYPEVPSEEVAGHQQEHDQQRPG